MNLIAAKSGDILVVSSASPQGTVYAFDPRKQTADLTVLTPQPAAPGPGASAVVPVNIWVNGELEDQLDPQTYEYNTLGQLFARDVATSASRHYLSPDGSLFLPAVRVFQQGPDDSCGMDETGWRWSHNLDAYGLIAAAGRRIAIISGAENRTYRATVQGDGTLTDLQLVAERGGESVAVDIAGNVTSPTVRCSSTTVRESWSARLTSPSGRCSSVRRADRRTPLHPHASLALP